MERFTQIYLLRNEKKLWSINYELAFLGNDAVRTKHDFYQIAGFPNVLGAVDTSLIPIICFSISFDNFFEGRITDKKKLQFF